MLFSCLKIADQKSKSDAARLWPWPSSSFYYSKTRILNHLNTLKSKVSSFLILKWAQALASHDVHLLERHDVFFKSENDIPREVLAQLLCDKILANMRADLKTKLMKSFNTKLVISVAEGLVEHISHHGDAAHLARVTGVSHRFACRVLEAVQSGEQGKLFIRERRRDSIIGSGVLDRFKLFISQPEQSRECPGTTISVAYKKKESKHLLLKSKPVLCQEFLALNEDITVKKSY